jgi:hypothetical protein
MSPHEIAEQLRALDWSAMSAQHQLAVSAAAETLTPLSNVVRLPVKQATRWTTIKYLDGSMLATSHDFGVTGAWSWIVDTVAHEHGIRVDGGEEEDRIGSLEGTEDQFDGDDLVMIDGLPVYRIEHTSAPFSK